MRAWIDQALTAATDLPGADQGCVVILTETYETNVRWANNALTTNGQMHHLKAQVVAMASVEGGTASGCLEGPVGSPEEVVELVRQAAVVAQAGTPDEDAHELPAGTEDEDFDTGAEATTFEVLAGVCEGLGRAFSEADDRHLFFGFAEHIVHTTWLGTSSGSRRRSVTRLGRLELNAKHPDMVGSAWVGRSTADFSDIDMDGLVSEVLERLSWCENRLDLPAGRYEVILPPSAVSDLMINAYWSMDGRSAREGQSVFAGKQPGSTRVGEQLASLPLTMASDPGVAGMECAPFAVAGSSRAGIMSVYDNGATVGRTDWISRGVLRQLVETGYEVERSGQHPATLPYPTGNLLLDGGGTATLDQMVASTKRGLLLTCLWYIREVDPDTLLLTGLTRDGVYLIEDGKVVGAVNNFRWNESPVSLLGRMTELSASERTLCREWNDWFQLTQAPAMRVPDFNMSTVSQAS